MGLTEAFYADIMKLIEAREKAIVDKAFTSKSGPIEEIPINIAKGQQLECKQLAQAIKTIYDKKYKSSLVDE